MKSSCPATNIDKEDVNVLANTVILAVKSGIYEGFDGGSLLKLCDRKDCVISILHPPGTFLMKGIPAANVSCNLSEAEREEFEGVLYIHQSESIEGNVFYGFRQLTEVGIKALSPGINDPGTAIQVMRSLFELYSYRSCHSAIEYIRNKHNVIRIVQRGLTFEEIFEATILPIWDYGKSDRMVRNEFNRLLTQLIMGSPISNVSELLQEVNQAINAQVPLRYS